MGQLMRQAKQLQEQLQQKQAEIEALRVTASSGGGMVTATVTGQGELADLAIEREVINPDEAEMLVDLIVAAVQQAQREAKSKSEALLGPLTQAMNLPGA
jgi:DNA-binding YbaB/EbfC family protein